MINFKLFIRTNLVLISSLIAFTTGSLTTSCYHQQQIYQGRKTFLECQLAWEKYYSLNNQSSQVTQPITSNQSL